MRRFLLIVVGCSALLAGCSGSRSGTSDATAFSFALIGDQQYDVTREEEFVRLMEQLDAEPLEFVVHVGDIKGGSSVCTDSLLLLRQADFNASRHPFILLFGDNEWTDCHRAGGDSLAQLNRLPTIFHGGEETLGQRRFRLERQSSDPAFAEFRENVRWQRGNVMFVMLHVVGSNNNLGRSPEADAEHARRTSAVVAWLDDSFRLAEGSGLRGVLIAMHANPFMGGAGAADGFASIMERLQSLVKSTAMPVILVHGDSHICRIDHPLVDSATGDTLRQCTRVEVFGYPNSHWIRGTMNPIDPAVFAFEPVLVPGNPEGTCAVG